MAISNGRLLGFENGEVAFQWRDSKDSNRIKVMTLDAVEFIRRFLLHILPSSFVKIRHFGFLSNRRRSTALALCRQRLPQPAADSPVATILSDPQQSALKRRCPVCQRGTLHITRRLSAQELLSMPATNGQPTRSILHDHDAGDQKYWATISNA